MQLQPASMYLSADTSVSFNVYKLWLETLYSKHEFIQIEPNYSTGFFVAAIIVTATAIYASSFSDANRKQQWQQ